MSGKHLPQVRLLHAIPRAEVFIAGAAKATLSPRDFTEIAGSISDDIAEKWIKELIRRGHGSPLEHSIYIFEITCSRACSHQLVRHRHASYSQLSQRYSDKFLRGLVKKACNVLGLEYVESYEQCASALRRLAESQLEFNTLLDIVGEAFIVPPVVVSKGDIDFLNTLIQSTAKYYEALAKGIAYEDARYLLSQAVKTKVIVSMNSRELLEVFLPLRMCIRAQWEIRAVAWNLWHQLMEHSPILFKYAGPRCVLSENRVRTEPCELLKFLSGECAFNVPRCPEMVPREQIQSCLIRASDIWKTLTA